jgi:YVTN family beta-propeller protein
LRITLLIAAMLETTGGCHRDKPSKVAIHQMSGLRPQATFTVKGHPDWMAIASDSVWVTSSADNVVTQLNATNNRLGVTVQVSRPCSGLAIAFGSLWIPGCEQHTLVRADLTTGKIQTTIPIGPANSEGGITVGAGSAWLMTDTSGKLSRIDPTTNTVIATIDTPSGSFCPLFADGFVWITSTEHNLLSKVDPATNKTILQIPVGQKPRFLTYGADSIWTLNQGDGTITRVSTKTNQRLADIAANIPGPGGEITFGFGSVWATVIKKPITRIDATTSRVTSQWVGAGGDSIRTGLGSIWLTSYDDGKVWRLSPSSL